MVEIFELIATNTDFDTRDLNFVTPTFSSIGTVSSSTPIPNGNSGAGATAGLENFLYRYKGKEQVQDQNFCFYEYGFRWYDAQIAKFVQVDPLADDYSDKSTYDYAENSPLRNVDLDGLEGVPYDAIWQVDISMAPGNYRVMKTTNTLYGWWQRNSRYYWDQVIKNYPSELDEGNLKLKKKGYSPQITPELIPHLESQGIDTKSFKGSGPVVGHHVNQGKTVVALLQEIHKEILHEKSGYISKYMSKINGLTNKGLGLLNIFDLGAGAYTGNPNSLWSQFESVSGNTKIGKIYIIDGYVSELSSRTYNSDGSYDVKYKTYESYSFDKKQKKYVGNKETGSYNVHVGKDGKSSQNL